MAFVSILMTVFNAGSMLHESIPPLLEQTYKDIEIIIVNDGSTDDSSQIISDYQKKDSRIVFIDRLENKGRSYSLNEGLSNCSSDYIAINDADDISEKNRIEVMMDFIKKNDIENSFGVVGSAHEEENRKTGTIKYYRVKRGTFSNRVSSARIFLGMPFIHSSFIYKKEALLTVGGFSSEVTSAIDYFTLAKIAKLYPVYAYSGITVKRVIDGNNFFLKPDVLSQKKEVHATIDNWQRANVRWYKIYKLIERINIIKKRIMS